ncbi:MAG TPA: carboxypeptidase-like regulatory domain-containing protein [Bryobacteraceae bacterium]|nr:carboxypeptidase-like regulatory domain-containing protein [Bryobacteraceae bacterium]
MANKLVFSPPGRLLAMLLISIFSSGIPSAAQPAQAAGKLNIVVIEGDGAINNIRQRVGREPIVQVEDENRKPVGGAIVTFLLPNQGASATFADGGRTLSVVSDEQGRAIARGLQPNSIEGKYEIRVTASKDGNTASTTISQANALAAGAGAAAGGGLAAKWIAVIAVAAAAAVAGGVVAARDNGNGNNRPSVTPTVITPGTPSVGAPR